MTDLKEVILYGPRTLSVGEYYLTHLQAYPEEKVAMVLEADGSELTYGQLLRRSKAVSGLLRSHGLGLRDTVMVCCDNSLEFPPVMIGTAFIGAAVAPVNPVFDTGDFLHALGVIQPQLVIANKTATPGIRAALAKCQLPVAFATMDAVAESWEDDRYTEDFRLGSVEDTSSHVVGVFCSSGTTGKLKAIEITHFALLAVRYADVLPEYEPGAEMTILNLIQPSWGPYHLTALYALSAGHRVVHVKTSPAEKYLKIIQKYKVNLFFTRAPEVTDFANYQGTDAYDLSSLRHITFWGSSLSRDVFDKAAKNLRCPITNVFGLSEGAGMLRPAYDTTDKPGNVGKLGHNMKAKVVDLNTGKTLGPNCPGELRFASWTSFKGYRGNPQATRDMFDEEGYMRTGDMGYYDEDGYFYISGRIKEIFKYKLMHVFPGDIEEVLLRHPGVLEVAVVGVDHDQDCQHARAFVVRRPGASVTEDELVKLVQERMPAYKWLYGGVRFVDDGLPRTSTGKIHTFKLRQSQIVKNGMRITDS